MFGLKANQIKQHIGFITVVILNIFIYSCAKEATPTGGPKDLTPPKVILEQPPNKSINFAEKKIKIYFNEFIKFENLREELLISPSFEQIPKIVVKGKKLIIHKPDSIPPNKTVTFNFYNAIVDVNENNILKNYQYVFSSGPIIDTNFIDGRIINAQTGLPEINRLVFMYESFEDSVISKRLPNYIARTNNQGIFVFNYIGSGPYKIFALEDKNRNNLYDQPTEGVAFLNDSIIPKIEWTTILDTVKIFDSINLNTQDTLFKDSIIKKDVQISSLKPFQLRLFVKDYKRHYLTTSKRVQKGLISLGFNKSIIDYGYTFEIIKPKPIIEKWSIRKEVEKDSILIWLTDSTLFNSDSIYVRLTYPYTDFSNNVIQKTDSIYFNYDFKKIQKTDTLITYNNNLRNNKLDIDSIFELTFSEPVISIDTSKISFKINTDTTYIPYLWSYKLTEKNTKLKLLYTQNLLGKYRLIIDSAAIIGALGNVNDSTGINFQYYEKENYGNIIFKVDTLPENTIYQLLTKKGAVFNEIKNPTTKKITFQQLPVGEYKLIVLIDTNGNGKWDTGNYYEKTFPELIIAFHGKLVVKANWDIEQNWNLSKELLLYE